MVNKRTGKAAKINTGNLKAVKKYEWICNKRKLQNLIKRNNKGIVFYCGTAGNLDELLPLFDKILLLKISPRILRNRLSNRKGDGFGQTTAVQRWVLNWKNWWEKHILEKGAIAIDANKKPNAVVSEILKVCIPSKYADH